MNDDERDITLPVFGADEHDPAGSPAGEIDLGKAPALGRRARLLAGMMTASVAAGAILSVLDPNTPGTTHTLPPILG